jgi:hypothetical protein
VGRFRWGGVTTRNAEGPEQTQGSHNPEQEVSDGLLATIPRATHIQAHKSSGNSVFILCCII